MIVMENNIKRELKGIKVKFDYVIEQDYVGIPYYGIGIENMRSDHNMKQIEESDVEKYLLYLPRIHKTNNTAETNIEWTNQYYTVYSDWRDYTITCDI